MPERRPSIHDGWTPQVQEQEQPPIFPEPEPDPRLVAAMTTAVIEVCEKNGLGIYATRDGGATWFDRRRFALAILPGFLADPRVLEVVAERLTNQPVEMWTEGEPPWRTTAKMGHSLAYAVLAEIKRMAKDDDWDPRIDSGGRHSDHPKFGQW